MRLLVILITTVTLISIPFTSCASDEAREAAPFSIQVNPPLVVDAYAGQAYLFSVTIESIETGKNVNISASATSGEITINPQAIKPGEVSKITVIPGTDSVGKTVIITIEGERGGLTEKTTAKIEMGDTGDSEGQAG